jgi:hypothetical protein
MRVAFLLLNHRQPEQLVRLLGTLRSQLPDSPIVVHHDVYGEEFPGTLIESIDNVHLLTSGKRVIWGDHGLAEVYCWSLAWMFEHLEFNWVVLLSAQDYPIKPLAGLADDLARGGADAVFQASPISQLPNTFERINSHHRYLYQYQSARAGRRGPRSRGVRAFLRQRTRSLVAALNTAQPLFNFYRLPDGMPYRLGWRARKTPFSSSWPCWKGSSWFALSRKALEYALNYMADHPVYVGYCSRTMHSDESMVATIVCNSPSLRVANRDVTYTRWTSRKSGHPDIFQAADLRELMAVPQYFARKFDIYRDARILDAIDLLIGQDVRPVEHS